MKKLWALLLTLALVVGVVSPITTVYAETNGVVMTVNGVEYTDHGTGWSAAVKLAKSGTETTVKLFADWVADSSTGFVCPDGGTKDGSLHVGGGKVTLDLNGYTLDRNANKDADTYSSGVLYVEDCTFTIDDTSAEKDGKITGGYALYGGGIYAEDTTKLTLNAGSICGNKAEYGGGVYTFDTPFTINGGSITDNFVNFNAGAIFVYDNDLFMYGGLIARNHAMSCGGAVKLLCSYENSGFGDANFYMYGGIIEDNQADDSGGALYLAYPSYFTMDGGVIRNNTAGINGGAIAHENQEGYDNYKSSLTIKSGTFTGNVAKTGHGGAICWDMYKALKLSNCTITGNSAPNGYGGGIYLAENSRGENIYGGTVNITGNTAYTERADNACNVYAVKESLLGIKQDSLNSDSKIGLSTSTIDLSSKKNLNKSSDFTEEIANCFFSDNRYYVIDKEKNGNYCNFFFVKDSTYKPEPLMTVETQGDGKIYFDDRKVAWLYALEQAKTTDVTLTLFADWAAKNGNFDYGDVGSLSGGLYVPRSCKKNITIDLNGYTISLGDTDPKYSVPSIFYVDCTGSLTIVDSSEAQTGTVTGGHNDGAYYYGPSSRLRGCGGAFYVDYGTLYIKGGNITGNRARYGGAIYCDDLDDASVYIQGGKIYGNNATKEGGGIYINNGYLYVEGGEITENTAPYGGGVYWDSFNAAYFTGGKIHGNTATKDGGGVYVESYSATYYGGDIVIWGNTNGNLYLNNPDVLGVDTSAIHNCCGQEGSPNKPLTDGAIIGIYASNINHQMTTSESRFNEGDFRYFRSDNSSYFVRAVYDPKNQTNVHKLYYNEWGHKDTRIPRVNTVSVEATDLLSDAFLDYDTQTITLVAHNTKKNFFENISLDLLISCTYDKDIYYLEKMDYMRDFREMQEYKIMSDNGTYVICKVNLVPEGGEWADNQEVIENEYKMIVKVGSSGKAFTDFGEGWSYAVTQGWPATVVLLEDWTAPDGKFAYSNGTHDGRLHLSGGDDITIDLNGNDINRGLTSAVSSGQVFRLESGAKLTITDTSESGDGKITGGYNSGNGGAFYIDYGKLYINGGEITGNKATNGAGIYGTNENDTYVYINGGKVTGNTASSNGGGIYMNNGYLYVDGGEITDNRATDGAGVYWASNNKYCLTDGVIANNTATGNGGGVYAADYGKMFLGGTIKITGNTKGNLYLSDKDVNIHNAVDQDGAINKPLTEGACVGITAKDKNDTISGGDSKFNESDFEYLYADEENYFIRAVYDANGGDNANKIYYSEKRSSITVPSIASVENKGTEMKKVALDKDARTITLKASYEYTDDRPIYTNLATHLDVYFDSEGASIPDLGDYRDFTKPQKYMVLGTDGTYSMWTVIVEWCRQHEDDNGDYICDECEEKIYADFVIIDYNAETREATVFVTKPGKYSLIFADYEDNHLANVDIVEYDFVEGINVVPQEVTKFTLASDDKVMLWYDLINLVPVCDALTIK